MYDDDLTNLDEWLRRLKVEYDIYFNGHRKRPPDDLRARVDKLAKRLSEAQNMTYSQRFRYTTLVSRFHVFRDLWRRTMMERELSEEAEEKKKSPGVRAAAQSSQLEPAADGLRVSITDADAEVDKVKRLYDGLSQIRKQHAGDSPPLSYQQFARYIATQIQGIRAKYGCSSVLFTVSLEENAVKFTASAEKKS